MRHPHHPHRAFSLVELLVVLGILGLLAAFLLPAMAGARRSAQTTLCATRMREIATALVSYAMDNRGMYPPNSAEIQQFWYQRATLDRYIRTPMHLPDATGAGGILVCPGDLDDAVRSYSMNVFASAFVSSPVRNAIASAHPPGHLFKFGVRDASRVILLAESWAERGVPGPADPNDVVWAAQAVVGFNGRPGQRFGADPNYIWWSGRFGQRNCQLCFSRHRLGLNRSYTDPDGSANFAFCDGHVSLLRSKDLADFSTGLSRYVALWSTNDPEADHRPDPAGPDN